MRALHILMPMAGEGSRFLAGGWITPKPMICHEGLPLFKRAVDSIHVEGAVMKYSFIVRENHVDEFHIDEVIRQYYPNANVASISRTTKGAVETCLVAEKFLDEDDAVLVLDCDLEFRSKHFEGEVKRHLLSSDAKGGVLVSFKSNDRKYSYAQCNANGLVTRTAEKEAISDNALCGAYFFSNALRFLDLAKELLAFERFDKPEYYVSLLYNQLISSGEPVTLTPVDDYWSYGTPEELNLHGK